MPLLQPANNEVYTNPRNDAHLRAVLDALRRQAGPGASLLATIADVVSPHDATFVSTTAAGAPVYLSAADTVDLADASALSTAKVIGLAYAAASAGGAGTLVSEGIVSVANWTSVIGAASLTAGAEYYLSETTGQLTTTAPTTAGACVVRVGIALSTTDFLVAIRVVVQL